MAYGLKVSSCHPLMYTYITCEVWITWWIITHVVYCFFYITDDHNFVAIIVFKGGRMGRSDKVSLWCVALLINTRFRFFILE